MPSVTHCEIEENIFFDTPTAKAVGVSSFITGQYDLDRWDEFMADLENQNVDQYLEIVNNAHQEFQANLEANN
ncbi:hypothetical protein GCM10008932_09300 [Alkalibacterium iburiense]|uniref:DUF3502 domain-containing protein n=1 Tax=Alkalibacterium iburiense TaxID=290589 RepID=A0ABP3H1L3_9LACT